MVDDAVADAAAEVGVRGILADHDQAVHVNDHSYPFVVLGFRHLLLHDLEHLLLLERVILQQQLVVQQQDVAHLLLSEEVDQLRNHIFDRVVLLRFEEQLEGDLGLLAPAVQFEGQPGLVVELH